METKIVLLGEPKSSSHIYKTRVIGRFASMYMSAEGKAIKESYQWQAKSQWHGDPIQSDVSLKVDLYFGTKRKSDIDNFFKLLLDSLTGIVYVDDSQIQTMTVSKHYDKSNPRIEVIHIA